MSDLLTKVKIIVYDFDGVLTDNRVWVSEDGKESVACNRSDGWWTNEIKKLGIEQIIFSTETNPVVTTRAEKLGLQVFQGISDKKSALQKILKEKNISFEATCYVGNEVNDLEAMSLAYYVLCPSDSHPAILKGASKVLSGSGGFGIVKNIYDWLVLENSSSLIKSSSVQWSDRVQAKMKESIQLKKALLEDKRAQSLIDEMISACVEALKKNKKIIFAGNGGSFSDSLHLSAEFISRFKINRQPLASIVLGCNSSALTAIGNDYGYENVFERDMFALGREGDVFMALSTSGNSKNILKAVQTAKEKKIQVFGWSGQSGGQLALECKTLCIPSVETDRIQECHMMVGHIICEIVEAELAIV